MMKVQMEQLLSSVRTDPGNATLQTLEFDVDAFALEAVD